MAEQGTVEQRLAALEREVADLKQQLRGKRAAGNWIEQISGSMADFPEFEEVVRYGREVRNADRPKSDDSAA